jgi:hypothetical protein
MRNLLRVVGLGVFLACTPALAGENVALTGRVMGISQYPNTNTICLSFETKDKKPYLICDDVTAKDIIEKLFDLGKKDAECRIDGTIAKKNAEGVYLTVTGVAKAS